MKGKDWKQQQRRAEEGSSTTPTKAIGGAGKEREWSVGQCTTPTNAMTCGVEAIAGRRCWLVYNTNQRDDLDLEN